MGSGHPSSPGEDLVLKVEPVLSGSHLLANSSSHEVVVCMARLSTTCQNYTRAEMEITHNPLPWKMPVEASAGDLAHSLGPRSRGGGGGEAELNQAPPCPRVPWSSL